ncbi:MAG: anaerobic ribonucleoside-triphosphate reductase activating protein [Parachlamydiales bacterium]|jgi:pyruvate formate lyase activating enzyme
MLIGGLQKLSFIDYPKKMAALIFTQGCPFLCQYCHNPNLVLPNKFTQPLQEDEVLNFLKKRKNQLEAVVITGGEPTIQKDLIEFIYKIKNLNFLVKLDTNGTNPEILKELIEKNLIDYIAMDIKAPLEKYKLIIQKEIDTSLISQSIEIIINSKVAHEFRTTLVKGLHEYEDIEKMSKLISNAELYILQKFIPKVSLNPNLSNYLTFSDEELDEMTIVCKKHVKDCFFR